MDNPKKFQPDSSLKLLPQVRQVLRYHHYAYRTEQTYCAWILRFVKFHGSHKHPRDMGKREIETFLSHLATHGNVSASTQQQAMHALLFLYREVLDHPMEDYLEPVRAKKRPKLPVVMTQHEVAQVLSFIKGSHLRMARLLYGSGLRLMECLRLRVQDLDIDRKLLYVRAGKGGKDRTTFIPDLIREDLKTHLVKVKKLHDQDLSKGY